ncbi:MAG: hypothetical protein AB1646_21220 [Thermodesulfobacteriota bacterium]
MDYDHLALITVFRRLTVECRRGERISWRDLAERLNQKGLRHRTGVEWTGKLAKHLYDNNRHRVESPEEPSAPQEPVKPARAEVLTLPARRTPPLTIAPPPRPLPEPGAPKCTAANLQELNAQLWRELDHYTALARELDPPDKVILRYLSQVQKNLREGIMVLHEVSGDDSEDHSRVPEALANQVNVKLQSLVVDGPQFNDFLMSLCRELEAVAEPINAESVPTDTIQ